jgi:hypothetical protein
VPLAAVRSNGGAASRRPAGMTRRPAHGRPDRRRAHAAPGDRRRIAAGQAGAIVAVSDEPARLRDGGNRRLRKSPVFTFVAVATLALAIGANTAVFGVLHSVLLTPLPYPDADRLYMIWETNLPQSKPQGQPSPAKFSGLAANEPFVLENGRVRNRILHN